MRRVIVIGLDGVNFDVIKPWIEEGRLPHLQRFMAKGVYSPMRSIHPIHTPSAWTGMMTGRDIDQHGLYDFFEMDPVAYKPRFTTSLDVQVPYIWELASQRGLKSIVINIPITHPPRQFDGILIPGSMAPENPPTHPPGILDEIKGAVGEYKLYWPNEVDDTASLKEQIDGFLELSKMRRDATLYLAQKYEWDLLIVQFQRTDSVFHLLNKQLSKKAFSEIARLFEAIDAHIGDITDLDTDATVFVVSDHGMGLTRWMFAINSWLKTKGYLKTKVDGNWDNFEIDTEFTRLADQKERSDQGSFETIIGLLAKAGINKTRIESVIRSLRLEKFVIKFVPYKFLKTTSGTESVDWEGSKAFCYQPSGGGIWINMWGRQPNGIVDPGSMYDQLCDQLVDELSHLTDPEGQPVFSKVARRETVYKGPRASHIPDIVCIPRGDNYKIEKRIRGNIFISNNYYFAHKTNGMIMVRGPGIVAGDWPSGNLPSILDLSPTVLCGLGLPNDPTMDGKPLLDIYNDSYRETIPAPSEYDLAGFQIVEEDSQINADSDKEKLEKHLQALGYLD